MTRIRLIDLQQMLDDHNLNNLYHALLPVAKAEPGGEVVVIDDAAIKGEAFRLHFAKWIKQNPAKVLATEQSTDELWQAESTQAQKDAQKAHVERHAQEAIARYKNYWIAERGLLNTTQNMNAVLAECDKIQKRQPEIIMSATLINIAVDYANISGALKWKPEEPELASPTPTSPAELELAWIEIPGPNGPQKKTDGTFQLPLNAIPSSRYSIIQLKDLDRRQQKERAAKAKDIRARNTEFAKEFLAKERGECLEL